MINTGKQLAAAAKIVAHGLNIRRAMRFTSLIGWCKRISFGGYYLKHIRPLVKKRIAKLYIALWTVRRRSHDLHHHISSQPV